MMKRSQDAISRAEAEVQLHFSAYKTTWMAIQALPGDRDPVLQELRASDLTMLSKWMEDERYRG